MFSNKGDQKHWKLYEESLEFLGYI